MVSLKTGLTLAVIGAAFLFRREIATGLASFGSTIGAGVGGLFGNAASGFKLGLGFTAPTSTPYGTTTNPVTGQPMTSQEVAAQQVAQQSSFINTLLDIARVSPLGGIAAAVAQPVTNLISSTATTAAANPAAATASAPATVENTTVTQYNRETSDLKGGTVKTNQGVAPNPLGFTINLSTPATSTPKTSTKTVASSSKTTTVSKPATTTTKTTPTLGGAVNSSTKAGTVSSKSKATINSKPNALGIRL